jgi:hypothetical protein
MSKRPRNAYCSFCRKSYEDVGPVVEGPGDVYICAECVDLCQTIIDQEKRRRGTAKSPVPESALRLAGHDWQVNSREEFVGFVYALITDLVQGNPEVWESRDLASYLKALAGWVGDMSGYYRSRGEPVPDPPTWNTLAHMLMAARVYE